MGMHDMNRYDCELTEQDFYPIPDDRMHCFGIDDIEGGDNYDDYLEYFWDNFEHELFD